MSKFELRLAQARLAEDVGEADKDNEEDSCAQLSQVARPTSSPLYRQLHGLKLAIKDPKVIIFAILGTSQVLGLSFSQYFPT